MPSLHEHRDDDFFSSIKSIQNKIHKQMDKVKHDLFGDPMKDSTKELSDEWERVGLENQLTSECNGLMRYGKGDKWVQKYVKGRVDCTNKYFEEDPKWGTFKEC